MIKFEVFTVKFGGNLCANDKCKHLPSYTLYNPHAGEHTIKVGTMALSISKAPPIRATRIGFFETYCYDCVDMLYKHILPCIDKSLWTLKE